MAKRQVGWEGWLDRRRSESTQKNHLKKGNKAVNHVDHHSICFRPSPETNDL